MNENTILIWGAGAIGGTLGAYLARAGEDVLLVDIVEPHVEAMKRDGLLIEGPVETFRQPVMAALPSEVTGQFKSGGAFGRDGKYSEFLQVTDATPLETVPK